MPGWRRDAARTTKRLPVSESRSARISGQEPERPIAAMRSSSAFFSRSVVDLQGAINRFVTETNNDPKPITWTADHDRIIPAVSRGHQVVSFHPLGYTRAATPPAWRWSRCRSRRPRNFLRTLATSEPIKDWLPTSTREKLIKIGPKVVRLGHYAAFSDAEVAIPGASTSRRVNGIGS